MSDDRKILSTLIVPVGTQVVLRSDMTKADSSATHPKGTIAEVIQPPTVDTESYKVRCADGSELSVRRKEFSLLKQMKTGPVGDHAYLQSEYDFRSYTIYECVVGSRAYGLDQKHSDIDRRGIYLPPAELQWSLYGVPEQLEYRESEECYWELQKFIGLALKANPNVLECLYTPIVEKITDVGAVVLEKRSVFLSKLVYQTYNGFVMSQFKKLEQDLRTKGSIKWKHAMHLIRLLLQGISVLKECKVPVKVEEHRSALLAIREGSESWESVNRWRLSLHNEFELAYRTTTLPDAPDYAEVNKLLVGARRKMVEVRIGS